jgi:hypothetical protein
MLGDEQVQDAMFQLCDVRVACSSGSPFARDPQSDASGKVSFNDSFDWLKSASAGPSIASRYVPRALLLHALYR